MPLYAYGTMPEIPPEPVKAIHGEAENEIKEDD
jgi:hypothetical protein